MKTSSVNGDRRPNWSPGSTPEARKRRGRAEFLPSFAELQEAVRTACSLHAEWEAKVVAGIQATLEFCAAHCDAAGALTINARERASDALDPEHEVLTYFAELLAGVSPEQMFFPISDEASLVESIAVVVRANLHAGTAAELPEHAVDLAYLALMPYVGLADAKLWAEKTLPTVR